MKTRLIALFVLVAAVAGLTGGWLARRTAPLSSDAIMSTHTTETGKTNSGPRKILYYQSAMHPWIKSDKPGRCTICGMQLSPVYEGESGFQLSEGQVFLGTNIVQVIHVQTSEVRRERITRKLHVAGTIDDDDSRHRVVSANIEGRIDTLNVNYIGAAVRAGQPLATFYSPALLAAEREYASLVQNPPSASLRLDHERLLSGARQRLRQLGLTDDQITAVPKKATDSIHSEIVAPISGTVVARSVYEGQYVKEGERLFEVADFSQMWFQADVYEADLAWLQTGQRVEVTSIALPGKTFIGKIDFIDPNLREMTRTAKVRIVLTNQIIEANGHSHWEIAHRLYAEARVLTESTNVLSIPRTAILHLGQQAVAYVEVDAGVYEKRLIQLGRIGDERAEVLSGLEEDEKVVTQGNLLIDAQAQLNAAIGPIPAAAATNE